MAAGAALEACAPATASVPATATGSAPSTTSSPATSADPTDIVFRGGTILTMDPEQPDAAAVAVQGDSIVAVGSEADVLAAAPPGATVVDLGDRVLLPGFNDAHCHRLGDRGYIGIDSAEEVIEDALAGGWTSITELFVNQERLDELLSLDDAGTLRLRVNAYLPVNFHEEKFGIWFNDYEPRQTFSPRVRIGGVKAFADWAGPDRMLLTEAHADQPGYRGEAYWEEGEFAELVRKLHDGGWQLATHTSGDAAHDFVLDAYEAALSGADNDLHRHRIEHALVVRDDQVTRMRDLGIVASIQLPFMSADWAASEAAALGPDRLAWAGRWRDMLEAGVPMVASTDYPWAVVDALNGSSSSAMRALWDGATRVGIDVPDPPSWMTDQALTVEQSLDLITRAGAYATFEEDRKGTITVGKLADLVILDADPRAVPLAEVPAISVAMTMIGGRVEYGALDSPR